MAHPRTKHRWLSKLSNRVVHFFTLQAKCDPAFGVQEHNTLVFKIPIPDPPGFDIGLKQAKDAVAMFGNALATVALTP